MLHLISWISDIYKLLQLEGLLQVYRRGMIRKAEALKVAVERGLRARLE
jgi:hypothetical protein